MLKNILVHIPSERSIRPITDSAISLAIKHSAHLDAVSIGFETANLGLSIDGAAAVAAIYRVEHESALARANAALAVFETEARNAGITYGLQPLTGGPAEIAAIVGTLARLYDLTVVLQPEPDYDTFDNTVPQEVLSNRAARSCLFRTPIKALLNRSTSASAGTEAGWPHALYMMPRHFWLAHNVSPLSASMRRSFPQTCPPQR
jgi:hypothetical protein